MKPRYTGTGFSSQRVSPSPMEYTQMAQQGRRAVFGQNGQFTAFASRPGAPLSPTDSIAASDPITAPVGSAAHNTEWNDFFHPNTSAFSQPLVKPMAAGGFYPNTTPTTPPGADPSYDAQNEDWHNPTDPAISDHNAASIANNTAWMGRNGIDVPPPPVPIDPTADAQQTGWQTTTPTQTGAIGLRYQTPPTPAPIATQSDTSNDG